MKVCLLVSLFLGGFSFSTKAQGQWAPADQSPNNGASAPRPGTNQLLIRTSDSLTTALQKMAVILRAQGYEVDSASATMLTTAGKPSQETISLSAAATGRSHVLYFLRVRAFRLPTGTQLQLTGLYLQQTAAHGPPYKGYPMSMEDDNRNHRTINSTWADNCFWEAQQVAKAYAPGERGYGFIRRTYTSVGPVTW